MNLKQYHESLRKSLESLLDSKRKNIVLLSYDPSSEPFGQLPSVLGERHNVVIVGSANNPEPYAGQSFVHIPFKIFDENSQRFHITPIQLKGIDLIIMPDLFEEQQLNHEFLNKDAKRLYIPRTVFAPPAMKLDSVDYIAVPSAMALPAFEQYAPNAKKLLVGSPLFDSLVALFEDNPAEKNLYYASSVQYANLPTTLINLYAGYDSMLLEWFLANYKHQIDYAPHIMNILNNHPCYLQIRQKWQAESRIRFVQTADNAQFAQSKCFVSDLSVFACHIALASLRQTILFAPAQNHKEWEHHALFGALVANNLEQMRTRLNDVNVPKEKFIAWRESNLYHLKHSVARLADCIDEILKA